MLDQNQLLIGISVLLSFFVGYKYGLKISRKGEKKIDSCKCINSNFEQLKMKKISLVDHQRWLRNRNTLLLEVTTRWSLSFGTI